MQRLARGIDGIANGTNPRFGAAVEGALLDLPAARWGIATAYAATMPYGDLDETRSPHLWAEEFGWLEATASRYVCEVS